MQAKGMPSWGTVEVCLVDGLDDREAGGSSHVVGVNNYSSY